jgi:outer membrane protein assembly factor BamB
LLLIPLVLATATTAQPAARLVPVLTGPSNGLDLVFGPDDTAYLIDESTIAAYRLPAGDRPLWRVDAASAYPFVAATDDPGLIVVDAGATNSPARSVRVLDSRTGAIRWERTSQGEFQVADDTVVLTDMVDAANTISGVTSPDFTGTLVGVDLRTGVTRWSRTLAAGTVLGYRLPPPASESTAIELSPDGRLRLVDLGTGAERQVVRLALAGTPRNAVVRGNLAVVQQVGAAEARIVIGYDLATGVQRWRVDNLSNAWPCDERWLCVYGDNVTSVIDPATGATRYRGQNFQLTIHGDRMLAWNQHRPGSVGPGAALFDLRTGRQIRSYGRWQVAADDPERGILATQLDADDRLLIAQLDLETGAAIILGTADGWRGDISCTWGGQYIACRGEAGYQVWPITSAVRPPTG